MATVHLCYPPLAYPFMPYLAPFLLKGYLESRGDWQVTTQDLNIAFHLYLWSGDFGQLAVSELEGRAARGQVLLAELIAERARSSWAALRSQSTYENEAAVRTHATFLRRAVELMSRVDDLRGARLALPDTYGAWARVLDAAEHSVVGKYLAEVASSGALDRFDVVGLTISYQEQLIPGRLFARFLKRRRPNQTVIVGGGMITHVLEDIRCDASFWTDVDYGVPFEGEHTFGEILDLGGGSPGGLKNALWVDCDRVVYRPDLVNRPRIEARPDFSDLQHDYPTPSPVYPLLTSKGCYWGKCAFCTHHEGYGQGFARLKDKLVEETIVNLLAQGARYFYLVDEALPPRMLSRLANLFDQHRPGDTDNFGWIAEARMEKFLAKTPSAELFRRSHCRLLVNGIESGCQDVVDAMQKGIDLRLVERFAQECHDAGIRLGWMFFIGYPGESRMQRLETFQFIDRNSIYIDFASVGTFALERGAPAWMAPSAHGIRRAIETPPYTLAFEYEVLDGSTESGVELRASLAELHAQFKHLDALFVGHGDRALSVFLPAKAARAPSPLERSSSTLPFEWQSRVESGRVRLNFDKGTIEIDRGARTTENRA